MQMLITALGIVLMASAAQAEWKVSQRVDKFTDKKVVTASTHVAKGALVVRCQNEDVEMYVDVGEYLSNRGIDFRYRLDDQPMIEDGGPPSADGTAVFFNFAASRARPLMDASKALFEVYDYRGVGHIREFSLRGSRSAISAVLDACGVRQTVPLGVDVDIIEGVDDWSGGFTLLAKEALAGAKRYQSAIDTSKPDELYLAVQQLKPEYKSHCRQNRFSKECMSMRMLDDGRISTFDLVEWVASPALRKRISDFWINR